MRRLGILACICLFALPAAAEESHPFNVRDLVTLDRISDPQVSPDGQTVAFVRRTTDLFGIFGLHSLLDVFIV